MTDVQESNNHDDAACVKLFADTLERLNEIAADQMQSILDIAIAAADAANSISTTNTTTGEDFVEKVTAVVEELKAKADKTAGGEPHTAGHDTAKSSTFCEAVERDINIAIENSLSNQQQLYVTGVAVLSAAAQLVLEAGGKEGGGKQ